MFKKFSVEESLASQTQVKSSVARGIKKKILDQYPMMEATIDGMMTKKATTVVCQMKETKTQIVVVDTEPIFFSVRDGPMMPTLRVLHKYPCLLNGVRVDKGAIRFVMGGANVAAPGMTHKTVLEENSAKTFEVGEPVAIYAAGMTLPMAVGVMTMGMADILATSKGMGIDNLHNMDDGLWRTTLIGR